MADVNNVILIGRLTRDAELKYTSGGMAVCKFAIAVNKRRKQGDQWVDEANFFDIVMWGRSGESLNQYLVKGKQVAVEGELHQNRWEQDGQARSKIEIMAENVQLLGGGQDSDGHGQGDRQPPQQGRGYHQNRGQQGRQPPAGRNLSGPPRIPQQPDMYDGNHTEYGDDGYPDDIPF